MLPVLRTFGLVVVLSFLSACTSVETVNPIGISSGSSVDTRLIGAWRVTVEDKAAEKGDAYVFVLPDKQGGLQAMAIEIRKPTSTDDNGWQTFKVLTGRAGDYTFLNLRGLLDDGATVVEDRQPKDGGYWPIRYRVETDGSVHLFLWDSADAIKDAIASGRLTGSVEGGTVHVTGDGSSVDAFFSEAGERAFPSPFATLVPLGSPQ